MIRKDQAMTNRALIVLLLFSPFLLQAQDSQIANTPFPHVANLVTLDKKTVSSRTFTNNGKPIIITFWLSTCKPCIKEQNAINRKLNQWRQEIGVRMIAVTYDPLEKLEIVKKIVQQNGWQHEVYLDKTKRFRNKMLGNWFGVPQLFIFDKDMNVVLHNYGYKNGDIENIEKFLKQLAEKIARSD